MTYLSVPLTLLLDKQLTPIERNTWMILNACADANQHVVNLSYTQLRKFLACVPGKDLASHETVTRALTILRLTRWIHLEPADRHLATNHYVVHPHPLSADEVC